MIFADLELSRRVELAEAQACAAFVEAHARATPECGAIWREVAGVRCIFDGEASPVTQTFGLGLWEPVTAEALQEIEGFFVDRSAPVYHEVSPLADPSAMRLLHERGYRPFEFTTVLVQALEASASDPVTICPVRQVSGEEMDHWSSLAAAGWGKPEELAEFFTDLAKINRQRQDLVCFYAEVEGQLAATGALSIHEGAVLAGASTVPEARGRGAQQSLLAARLHYAAQQGCSLAVMGALPGSASQRNAQRNGFAVAYTRLKWQLIVSAA